MERVTEPLIQVVCLGITGSILTLLLIASKKHILNQCGVRFWDKILFFVLLLFILPIKIPQFLFDRIINPLNGISNNTFVTSTGDIVSNISKEVQVTVTVVTIGDILFLIWLIGALSFLTYSLMRYRKSFKAIIQTSFRPHKHNTIWYKNYNESQMKNNNITLLVNGNIVSPMTIKFFKPIIVLPNSKLSDKELTMILIHEMTHIRRRDQWKKLLMVFVNAIHWFNPIIYLLLTNMEESFELSCDQAVTNNTTVDERRNYCELILHLLWKKHNTTTFYSYMSKSKKNMFRRFAFIMEKKKGYKKSKIIVTAVTIGLLCVILTFTGLGLNKDVFGSDTVDYGEKIEFDNYESDLDIYDLNQNGTLNIKQKINDKEIYVLSDKLKTNSKKITITNKTPEQAVMVYLFTSDDTKTSIMQFSLDAEDLETFKNLTASLTYMIGISVDISDPTLIELDITS